MVREQPSDGSTSVGDQVKVALLVIVAGALVVGGFGLLALLADKPFKFFSKEPAETANLAGYAGWMAHTIVLVWVAGGSAALVVGAWLARQGAAARFGRFLIAGGLFTALLVADDFFLLHESVYPKLRIPEEAVYLFYAVCLVALARSFADEVRGGELVLLVLAGAFLGVSVMSDFVQETWGVHVHVVEDGAKLLGVFLWTAFLVRSCFRGLRAAMPAAVP